MVQARNGSALSGLTALEALLQKYPDDPHLLADTTIVANWAGNDELTLNLYKRRQTPKDDAGVVEAAARAARNLHQYDESIDLYRRAQKLEPARWESRLGEAMALTDRGDLAEAANVMQPLLKQHKDDREVILGEGYLCSRQEDYACAIAMYQHHLDQSPNDIETRADLALALSHLGGQTYASALYTKDVTPPKPETSRGLKGAAAGEMVNWGESYAPVRVGQIAESRAALVRLNDVIKTSKSGDDIWRAAQFDRIVVLNDLHRNRDVIQMYKSLIQQGIDVPEYALANVAGAYLEMRQPEFAEQLYRRLLTLSPNDGNLWSGLAYAQMERGHAKQALATIDHAYKSAEPIFRLEGMSEPKVNPMRINLEMQAAEMRVEVNRLDEAQTRLERLAAAAPGNEMVCRQLAVIYLARGWPSRALKESRLADKYATSDDLPSLAQAQIHNGAGMRDDVDKMLPILRDREYDSVPFTRFLNEQRIEKGWQFDQETALAWGNGLQVGNNDQHTEAYLYSPLFYNRWRVYAHELHDSGNFGPNLSAARVRGAAGMKYDYNRREAWGEFGHDAGSGRMAGALGTTLALNDVWTLKAQGDSDSFSVPVRALTGNVYGRSLNLNIERRTSELSSSQIGWQGLAFSDGNRRSEFTGDWNSRIYTGPRVQANISAQGATSSNSLDENRPYFNPKHDLFLGPRATVDWLTWQRYDHSFDQRAEIFVAPYWQSDYRTSDALSFQYEQFWKLGPAVKWHYGLVWSSQPYDGLKETSNAFTAGVSWGSD